jgi:hypothetical protein
MADWPEARARKFRLAAFVYLHYAVLLEAAAYTMWRLDILPRNWFPPALWVFLVVPLVVAGVFAALLRWKNVWFVRLLWLSVAGRLPWLVHRAFVAGETGPFTPGMYLTGIVATVVTMWMLARAAWDL